ncbi:hypothetical protein K8I28_13650 [bacterium]|nr:hypothetical protein [bacterium]
MIYRSLILLLFVLFLVPGCDGPPGPPGQGLADQDLIAPSIRILSPKPGIKHYDSTLTLQIEVIDTLVDVDFVEYFINGSKFTDDTQSDSAIVYDSPYLFDWNLNQSNVSSGLISISALATDENGNSGESPTILINYKIPVGLDTLQHTAFGKRIGWPLPWRRQLLDDITYPNPISPDSADITETIALNVSYTAVATEFIAPHNLTLRGASIYLDYPTDYPGQRYPDFDQPPLFTQISVYSMSDSGTIGEETTYTTLENGRNGFAYKYGSWVDIPFDTELEYQEGESFAIGIKFLGELGDELTEGFYIPRVNYPNPHDSLRIDTTITSHSFALQGSPDSLAWNRGIMNYRRISQTNQVYLEKMEWFIRALVDYGDAE